MGAYKVGGVLDLEEIFLNWFTNTQNLRLREWKFVIQTEFMIMVFNKDLLQ